MAMKATFKHSTRVRVIRVDISQADPDAVQLFELPAGTTILGVTVAVDDAFNAGAVLDIGVMGDPDAIVDGQAVSSTGVFGATLVGLKHFSNPTIFTATLSDKTQDGHATLAIQFTMDKDSQF